MTTVGRRASDRPRILLTGPRGQVGRELRRVLSPLGELICGDRVGEAHVWLNLSDPDSIRRAVRESRPRLIVNAAAYTAVDRAEVEEEVARSVNGTAPGVLAEEAARLGAGLVHYSTDYVFDGSGDRPWRECDPTGPLNAYGRSKVEGESAIRGVGVPHLILRVCWVYAASGRNFLRTMLLLGRDRDEISVVADQFGAPTSARAIAEATGSIIGGIGGDLVELLAEGGGTFHLCCGGETSWHGFAEAIFTEARRRRCQLRVANVRPIRTADYPTPARRPSNSRLNRSLIADRFGIELADWRDELRRCMDDSDGECPTEPLPRLDRSVSAVEPPR